LDAISNDNKKSFFWIRILLIEKQEITQTTEERMIKSGLSGKVYNEAILPTSVLINTFQKKETPKSI
jgi:hypothetical protein